MCLSSVSQRIHLLLKIILIVAGLCSSGCSYVTVTDEEKLIIRKTAAAYQAEVSARFGYRLPGSKHKNKGRHIEISLTDPKSAMAAAPTELVYLASGCAYAICKARFQAGATPYDFVRVIIRRNGQTESFEYSANTIELYRKQYVRIGRLLAAIRRQGFHKEYFNESYTDSAQAYRMRRVLRVLNPDSMLLIGFKEGRIDSSNVLGIGYVLEEIDRRIVFITDLDSSQAPFLGFQPLK